MFRFEHPSFFWWAAAVVLMAGILFWRQRRHQAKWKSWGSMKSNARVVAQFGRLSRWKWLPLPIAVMMLLAMANPQWGYRSVAVQQTSADIYLLLDISSSMLAQDVAPSRLERARRLALDISDAFRTDQVGLIVFAGNAYIQSPLTTDWHAIQLFLNAVHPDQAGTQGTSIGEAIRLAIQPKQGSTRPEGGALIVITDGEDHDSDAPDAVSEAALAGWATYIIGVGTAQGASIPVVIDGVPDVKRDESGQPVHTALNRDLMESLAEKGKGTYYDLQEEPRIIEALKQNLAELERVQTEKRSFSEHKSYFQLFLLPAVLLLVLQAGVHYRKDVI